MKPMQASRLESAADRLQKQVTLFVGSPYAFDDEKEKRELSEIERLYTDLGHAIAAIQQSVTPREVPK